MEQEITTGYYKNIKHQDADEFTTEGQHFTEFGRYTNHPYNTSPRSRYYKYWEEQARRCVYGHNIGRDWIPGYYYHFLNFCPMLKAQDINKDLIKQVSGMSPIDDPASDILAMNMAERVAGFPDFWDGHYKFYHYLNDAEMSGEHGAVVKSRTKGFSFLGAGMMNRNYHLLPATKSYAFADDKEYLTEEGILSKCWEMMDFHTENTAWGKRRQKKNADMHRRSSYLVTMNGLQVEKGFMSEIIGVSLHHNYNKAHPYSAEVETLEGRMIWKDVHIGQRLFGRNGNVTTVKEVHEQGIKDVYDIVFNDGRIVQSTLDHLWSIVRWSNGYWGNKLVERNYTTEQLINILKGPSVYTNSLRVRLPKLTEFGEQSVPINAYTLGLMIGDGSISKATNNQSPITMKHSDMDDIKKYIPYQVRHENWGGDIRNVVFIENGKKLFKGLGLYDKKAGSKFIPDIYKYNTSEIRFNIINGLLDSDGSVTNDYGVIEYSTKSEKLASDFMWIVHSLGLGGSITKRKIKEVFYYRCYIYCNSNETKLFNLSRKKERIKLKKNNRYAQNKVIYSTIISIKYSHQEQCKCVTVDAEDSIYLINEFVPTHNSRGKRGKLIIFEEAGKFPHLLKAWNIALRSVRIGRKSFGLMVSWGTGGTEDADFMGLEQLFYEGGGYQVHMVPNKWDISAMNQKCGFFYSAAQNYEGHMDKNGNSDFLIATKIIEAERDKVKKETKNPEAILRHIAEDPLTPQEAVLRVSGSLYPVNDLKQHLAHLRMNPSRYEATEYIGNLSFTEEGRVKWSPDGDLKPIRTYPHNNTEQIEGCIVIYEHPVPGKDGLIPHGVYIAGSDNYDHDQSTTQSLGSTFIMNRLTERIVAEYTGRPRTAPMYYERQRRLLLYYNALCNYENNLKGLHGYLDKMHATHLLCDTPPIIIDKLDDKSLMNRGKGTPGTLPIKKWGHELNLNWLLTPTAPDSNIMQLHKVRSQPLLQELIYHSKDGNFDRVDALIYLLIFKEQLTNLIPRYDKSGDSIDPFFANNPLFKENLKKTVNDPFQSIKQVTQQGPKEPASILDHIPKYNQ